MIRMTRLGMASQRRLITDRNTRTGNDLELETREGSFGCLGVCRRCSCLCLCMFVFGIHLLRVVCHYTYFPQRGYMIRVVVSSGVVSSRIVQSTTSYNQSPIPSHYRLLLDQPPALELDRLPFQIAPADRARPGRRGWHRLGLDLERPPFPASLSCLPSPISNQQQHADENNEDDG